ncbi:thioredoxin family protein [Neolewinella aurantiaca]|uniref:Thioredoxin family protein n=1 Tax=Neolewinella aurantiaca TaxID=2602767 RepID=A0A5C7FWI4_9BACT|nr:thioredoxin family protein [Neolewinella aurantiaca]
MSHLSEHKSLSDSSLNLWLNQSDQQLVLVVFKADWAGGVAILKGFIDKILIEMPGVQVYWVDVESNKDLSLSFGINQIPSIIMLRDHEVVDHINGILPRRKLSARMARHL